MTRQSRKPRRRVDAAVMAERELINSIKHEDPFPGATVKVSPTDCYRIRTIGRGEQVFYQQNDRAILVEISARSNVIFRKSVQWWDTGERVNDEEIEVIVRRLAQYLTSPRDPPVTVSDD